jgi:hypothetical protein
MNEFARCFCDESRFDAFRHSEIRVVRSDVKRRVLQVTAVCLSLLLFTSMASAQSAEASKKEESAISTQQQLTDYPSRIAYLRQHLRVVWAPVEAGGAWLVPPRSEADVEKNFEALMTALMEKIPTSPNVSEEKRAEDIFNLLGSDVRKFFASAKFEPGTYRLDNYHLDSMHAHDGKLALDGDGRDIDLPPERVFAFAVTEQHLKLLHHFNMSPWWPALMDIKRPYDGENRYYVVDIARALGETPVPRDPTAKEWELFPEQEARFQKLHAEMLFATQAFWTYAQVTER